MAEHILIMDDEPALREVMGEVLAAEGHRVTTADDGARALSACARADRT